MSGQPDLLGKELNNARVRLLSPITEEGSLYGSPSPRGRHMVLLTSRLPGTQATPQLHFMPPINQKQRAMPAVPVMYTSPELQTLISNYLGERTYGRVPLTRTNNGSRLYCKCCEGVNEINRAKRKQLRGDVEEEFVEEIYSDSRELVPYRAPVRQPTFAYTELINGSKPGEYPSYMTNSYFPISAQYDGWDENRAPGIAALTYGYSPRRNHRYSSHDYDMTLGETDRYIKEDLLNAASKYDASMTKLKGTVDYFDGYGRDGYIEGYGKDGKGKGKVSFL